MTVTKGAGLILIGLCSLMTGAAHAAGAPPIMSELECADTTNGCKVRCFLAFHGTPDTATFIRDHVARAILYRTDDGTKFLRTTRKDGAVDAALFLVPGPMACLFDNMSFK